MRYYFNSLFFSFLAPDDELKTLAVSLQMQIHMRHWNASHAVYSLYQSHFFIVIILKKKDCNCNQEALFFFLLYRFWSNAHTHTHTQRHKHGPLLCDKGLRLRLWPPSPSLAETIGQCAAHVPQQSTEQLFEEAPSHGRSGLDTIRHSVTPASLLCSFTFANSESVHRHWQRLDYPAKGSGNL